MEQQARREAFDRGAVEALRWYIAKTTPYATEAGVEAILRNVLDEWEEGSA